MHEAPNESPAKPRVLRSPLLDLVANSDESWDFRVRVQAPAAQ